MINHEHYMNLALQEAEMAAKENEVPIGAVVVMDGFVIGKGHNYVEKMQDATAHAEIIAITSAMEHLNSKFLNDCILYTTLEPCLMCAGAIINSRISYVICASKDEKNGFTKFINHNSLSKNTKFLFGIKDLEASSLLKNFFKDLRI